MFLAPLMPNMRTARGPLLRGLFHSHLERPMKKIPEKGDQNPPLHRFLPAQLQRVPGILWEAGTEQAA